MEAPSVMEWIRESNLIEGVDDPTEDARCLRAWNWFVKQELNIFSVLALHRKIMRIHLRERKLLSQLGKFRTMNVFVGTRICPPWYDVEGLMQDWFRHDSVALNKWTIKEAHVAFQKIHPFIDGNGRVGRMVMNWQRMREGMDPICIKATERGAYYAWFE